MAGLPGDEVPCLACLGKPGLYSPGDRIRAHRLAAGLSRAALARRAGVSRHQVGTAESGRHQPTPDTLRRLAKALGVKAADLDPLRGEGA
jgi:transcriptional regulator with XRE-family HTH domain